jgi:uncharacterized protein YciI
MYIVELTYLAPLSAIDEAMKAHVAFLNRNYAAGIFIASGRKVPRDGGIIVATGTNREALEQLMQQDPFCSRGLATFRIIEFRVSQRAADLQAKFDAEPAR